MGGGRRGMGGGERILGGKIKENLCMCSFKKGRGRETEGLGGGGTSTFVRGY